MKKKIIGYTSGVFDLFHVGHVRILKKAKKYCDFLIVAVTTDSLVKKRKNKNPVIPYKERIEIVKSIKYVDMAVGQSNMNKKLAFDKYKFDIMFVGSDWKGTAKWNELEKYFEQKKIKIKYFPYTKSTSSTKINRIIDEY